MKFEWPHSMKESILIKFNEYMLNAVYILYIIGEWLWEKYTSTDKTLL